MVSLKRKQFLPTTHLPYFYPILRIAAAGGEPPVIGQTKDVIWIGFSGVVRSVCVTPNENMAREQSSTF